MLMTPIEHLENRMNICEADIEELNQELAYLRGYAQTAFGFRDSAIGHLGTKIEDLRKELNRPPKD